MAKSKLIWVVTSVILIALAIKIFGNHPYSASPSPQPSSTPQPQSPQIVSVLPSPLDGAIILPTQSISVTFSEAFLTAGGFKYTLEPNIDHKISISGDAKTMTITPNKPYDFNQSYTLHISSDTTFDNGKKLGSDKDFHFRIINYSGV